MTRPMRSVRALLATAVAAGALLAGAPVASADFGLQTLTGTWSDATGAPVTQAGAHPDVAVGFDLTTRPGPNGTTLPQGSLKDVQVDLPPGLVGDPTSLPTCSQEDLGAGVTGVSHCPTGTQVGIAVVRMTSSGQLLNVEVPVLNMDAPKGVAAQFAFNIYTVGVRLDASLRPGDQGITLRVRDVSQTLTILGTTVTFWGVPQDPAHDLHRFAPGASDPGVPLGGGGTGPLAAPVERRPFLTAPTQCGSDPLTTTLRVTSWQEPGRSDAASFSTDAGGTPLNRTGCDLVPFAPTMSVAPSTDAPDAPTGLDVTLRLPQSRNPDGLSTATLRRARVTLPEGMTISPSSADGLAACPDADLRLGSDAPIACPDRSRLGTVTATTPLLAEPLTGGIYLRAQASDDPESGAMFRIAIALESPDRGVSVRLPGTIRADRATGRLETTFDATPQLPFDALTLSFKNGPRAPLATPSACGTHVVDAELTAWSGTVVRADDRFATACSALPAFAPEVSAGMLQPVGGAFSPFALRLARGDGQDTLRGVRIELPTGVTANLRGVPRCAEAAAVSGTCPAASRVGTATIGAGPGAAPFHLPGSVSLGGPYAGAPFSLSVAVRAIAGPFDLGTVVVRQALFVDRDDAHVTVVSDPLPQIVKGVPLRLRTVDVDVDRPGFMLNPTSCAPKAIVTTVGALGGAQATTRTRFQVGGCAGLPLAPRLTLALSGRGQTRDGRHPGLAATMTQAPGEAATRRVAVTLPRSLALDPDNAQALCTPAQAAARDCPASSIVGHARAVTRILDAPLDGPVYFVQGLRRSPTGRTIRTLPKLWIPLRGEIALDLHADSAVQRSSSRLVTTFPAIPDAPLERFDLTLAGGKHGILVVTGDKEDICTADQVTDAAIDGQNGKRVRPAITMATPCPTRVLSRKVGAKAVTLRIGGLGAGRVTVSGAGLRTTRRTLKAATVATVQVPRTAAGRRAGPPRRARVTFRPAAGGKARTTAASLR